MSKSEGEILADVYEKVRGLSKMFISGLKDVDLDKRPELDNVKLNSARWILAHLVWSEHFLLIQGLGGEDMNIDWMDEYGFGSNPDEIKYKPDQEEILRKLDEVHDKAVQIIRGLSDEQLEEDNLINANFGGSKNKRTVITHAIRHEPMHIGQISWILKSNGKSFA